MKNLAHLAFKSQDTFGRALPPEEDRDRCLYFMDPFLLDFIKILNSKAIRRLKGKTQVISSPTNIYLRDRLSHSFEVSAGALQTGARLGLNVNLLQVGGLGHDLAHVPMGHLGEKFIAEKLKEPFCHENFVIFVLEMIERDGVGLNLSYETLDIFRNHSRGKGLMENRVGPLENNVVMIEDKLSYVSADKNDIQRICLDFKLPEELALMESDQADFLNSCHQAFWKESLRKGEISFEDSEEAKKFKLIRDSMYRDVYCKLDRQLEKEVLNRVYDYFKAYFSDSRQASLTIALMSEADVFNLYELLSYGNGHRIEEKLRDTSDFSIAELLPMIPGLAEFNFCNSDKFMDKNNFGKISKAECFAF